MSQKKVEVTPVLSVLDEEQEKRKLLAELVVGQAKEIAPNMYAKFFTQVLEPNEDASGIDISNTLFWANSPWGQGLAAALYTQIYTPSQSQETEAELHLSRAECDRRKNIVRSEMNRLLQKAEKEDWSPLQLFGRSVSAFYERSAVAEGRDRGRVSADSLLSALEPFRGDTYASRYSYMKAICALYRHCPEAERDMSELLEERIGLPDEWQLLHEEVSSDPAYLEKSAPIKENVSLLAGVYQVPPFLDEISLYDGPERAQLEVNVKRIVELIQDIYATNAAKIGFTAETIPTLMFLHDPSDYTVNDVLAKDELFASAGYVNMEPIGQIVVVHTAVLAADMVRFYRRDMSDRAVINDWIERLAHELHHALMESRHASYKRFSRNCTILSNAKKFNANDDYDYIPVEAAAYRWGYQFNRYMAITVHQLALMNGVLEPSVS